tara:strand:- start:11172 stop:11390 length:219 start_codon:yes stop_codon:yes gene_type:complete
MITELIKELVGLAVEKAEGASLSIYYSDQAESLHIEIFDIDSDKHILMIHIGLTCEDAPAQLQAAIDKVREL